MTPEEQKAKELIEKFSPYVRSGERTETETEIRGAYGASVIRENAKKCALIVCDEMVDEPNGAFVYWENVRSHIQSM